MKTNPRTIRFVESSSKFYLIQIGRLRMARLHYRFASMFVVIFLLAAPALLAQSGTIQLTVDATQVPLGIVKTHMVMPVHAGPLTLYYPKWIPGEHGPDGPDLQRHGTEILRERQNDSVGARQARRVHVSRGRSRRRGASRCRLRLHRTTSRRICVRRSIFDRQTRGHQLEPKCALSVGRACGQNHVRRKVESAEWMEVRHAAARRTRGGR